LLIAKFPTRTEGVVFAKLRHSVVIHAQKVENFVYNAAVLKVMLLYTYFVFSTALILTLKNITKLFHTTTNILSVK
jgi:hypothetical protein